MEVNSAVEFCGGCIILHGDCENGVVKHRLNIISWRGVFVSLPALYPYNAFKKPKGLEWEYQYGAANILPRWSLSKVPV
jgi:hypothetical protein